VNSDLTRMGRIEIFHQWGLMATIDGEVNANPTVMTALYQQIRNFFERGMMK